MAYKKLNHNKSEKKDDVILVSDKVVTEINENVENNEEDEIVESIEIVDDTTDANNEDEINVDVDLLDDTEEVVPEVIEVVTIEEEKEDIPEITLVKTTNTPIEPKKVRIRLKVNHKCFIGGNWYYFKKGEVYSVPQNVKNIMVEADLLLPL